MGRVERIIKALDHFELTYEEGSKNRKYVGFAGMVIAMMAIFVKMPFTMILPIALVLVMSSVWVLSSLLLYFVEATNRCGGEVVGFFATVRDVYRNMGKEKKWGVVSDSVLVIVMAVMTIALMIIKLRIAM